MKRTAFFLFLCASLPAPALAQAGTAASGATDSATAQQGENVAPLKGRNGTWSLKAPKRKRPGPGAGQPTGQQTAKQDVEGPAVPPPMRQKIPQSKPKQAAPDRQSNHVNATPVINSVIMNERRRN